MQSHTFFINVFETISEQLLVAFQSFAQRSFKECACMKKTELIEKTVALVLIAGFIAGIGLNVRIADAQSSNSSDFWLKLGQDAWNYFQPGVGVDSGTGLAHNNAGSNEFTDWDLALYVQAILDAEKLGIVSSNGTWGANDRLNKVLTFLETRPLMNDGYPYATYYSTTGKNSAYRDQVATDAGCLFVSLKNVEIAKPELKQRIDNVVYNITNFERGKVAIDNLLGDLQRGDNVPTMYDYYVAYGFACFWPERFSSKAVALLNYSLSRPVVDCYGINLPSTEITMEPLLLELFNIAQPDPRIVDLSKNAYLAQEARFNMTGKYTAFSEGGTDSGVFVYELIASSDGRTWVLQTIDATYVKNYISITPIVYLKAATGFLALYNTAYAQNMVEYLLKAVPNNGGFGLGVDENGRVIDMVPDVGNGLIVSAARYAVSKNITVPLINATPSPSPTVSSNSGVGKVETVAPSPIPPTSTPAPTLAPSIQPKPSPSILPDGSKGSVGGGGASENWLFLLAIFAVVVGLLVLGYRFGRKR